LFITLFILGFENFKKQTWDKVFGSIPVGELEEHIKHVNERLEEVEDQIWAEAEMELAKQEKEAEKREEEAKKESKKENLPREHPWNFLQQSVRPRLLTKPAGAKFWSVKKLGLTYYQYEKLVTLLNFASEDPEYKEYENAVKEYEQQVKKAAESESLVQKVENAKLVPMKITLKRKR